LDLVVIDLSQYEFSLLRVTESSLYRARRPGFASILVVEPLSDRFCPECLRRLNREYALREELKSDFAARPIMLTQHRNLPVLVSEDPGGVPLEGLIGRSLDIESFLRLAIPIATTCQKMHEQGLIHKDIRPANILVDVSDETVRLIGFGIASRHPRDHQSPVPPDIIAGTLAYMAPEQTGWMNRSVDSRSDLYALGVTFYQMLTGSLMFTTIDPMELVHCHIARRPIAPMQRRADIPEQISHIVMKLVDKSIEDRYQTAAGVAADLRRCLDEWTSVKKIEGFQLGTRDISNHLRIPEKPYGREREIEKLLSAFERVAEKGVPQLVLVSGYSGIGKSTVVNELHVALLPSRGLFAAGKFDQYKSDIPYSTLAQAFQGLIRMILGRGEDELARWRQDLQTALGSHGQLIINIIPDLELVIGRQTQQLPEVSPQEAQNRFLMVFRRFVRVFARPEHPLALFVDDLQWVDNSSLDLIRHLVSHDEVQHLMLIGAYRDNEVPSSHPLKRTIAELRKQGASVWKSFSRLCRLTTSAV
jgi:serine/threonine protein kinase